MHYSRATSHLSNKHCMHCSTIQKRCTPRVTHSETQLNCPSFACGPRFYKSCVSEAVQCKYEVRGSVSERGEEDVCVLLFYPPPPKSLTPISIADGAPSWLRKGHSLWKMREEVEVCVLLFYHPPLAPQSTQYCWWFALYDSESGMLTLPYKGTHELCFQNELVQYHCIVL
jgi:hypothetical protein